MAGSHKYDLSEKYHVLLAGGPYNSRVAYHTAKLSTADPVSLSLITSLSGGRGDILFRVHGLLMLVAWVGCAGAGKMIARYFKKTWRGSQVMGKDVWFVLHRLLMSLVVILSIAAVILILVEVQVDPLDMEALKINPHPVIGLICLILTVIQPIMAMFRPHPGTSNRPLFNWAHWLVGNSAHIFAIVALFLAGSLAKTNLAGTVWWSWLLLAYIIFHVMVHLVMSLVMAKEARSSSDMDTPMTDMNGKKLNMDHDFDDGEVGSGIRKSLISLYLVLAWGIAIALIIAVFNA